MTFQLVMAQLASTANKQENLKKAEIAVQDAKQIYEADIIVFPEVFMHSFPFGTPIETIINDAETIDDNFVSSMRALARKFKVWLIFGFSEKCEDEEDGRAYNSVAVVDSDGALVSTYRKTHLYDAFGAHESLRVKPGDKLFEPIDTPFGKIGIFVCYELRFPEIARYQAIHGAEIIIVPTAWVGGPLKELHWKNIITTRAIENTVFMVGCNKVRDGDGIGQSIVVDPMGVAMVNGPETEALISCSIDLNRIEEVRKKLPSHLHRRPELYTI